MTVEEKSFREIASETGRDKKNLQSRYADAMAKIRNSPLANAEDERKNQESQPEFSLVQQFIESP